MKSVHAAGVATIASADSDLMCPYADPHGYAHAQMQMEPAIQHI
jgi:hypothetical protein